MTLKDKIEEYTGTVIKKFKFTVIEKFEREVTIETYTLGEAFEILNNDELGDIIASSECEHTGVSYEYKGCSRK